MAEFLVHTRPDGKPVGVFTASEEYYDPEYPAAKVTEHVRFVREDKGPLRSWDDWSWSIAGQTPVGRDMMRWVIYPHRRANLQVVLRDAQKIWEKSAQ